MSRFKLKETTVETRGVAFVIRELTHAERTQWIKDASADAYRGPALLVSLGVVSPKVTVEEVDGYPSDCVTELFGAIAKISGIRTAGDGEKQPDAG